MAIHHARMDLLAVTARLPKLHDNARARPQKLAVDLHGDLVVEDKFRLHRHNVCVCV